MRLIDAPIGIFRFDGELVLKTEYYSKDKQSGKYIPDCYIIRTGEYFWGSAKTANELINLDIEPVDFAELLPTVTDTISRQAAIDALDVLCQEHRYKIPGKRETYSQYNEAWQDALDRAEGAIFNLPPAQPYTIHSDGRLWLTVDDIDKVNAVVVDESKSKFCKQFYMDAQPEPKRGKWLPDNNNYIYEQYVCSECKNSFKVDTCMGKPMWNFCPYCGARMEGTE